MFNLARASRFSTSAQRAFSTSASRQADVSKLILVGRLGREAETRRTQSDKEYVQYTIATRNFPAPPPGPDGIRPPARTSWHNVFCFNPNAYDYLRSIPKGATVYAEANYELREADPSADPSTSQGQRQIFLRHESVRVLKYPVQPSDEGVGEGSDKES